MNAIKFGKFLADLRNEKKLTQEELAEKLFIDKRKISRWECGMCIPDFETLIELSSIFDITLYELSICRRLEKRKLNDKIINKFKNIKDFKKFQLRKKILIIASILLGIFFIIATIYLFKYYGEVEIYKLRSLDNDYILDGAYIKTNDYEICTINNIAVKSNKSNLIRDLNNCEFEIYNKDIRILDFKVQKKDKDSKNIDSSLFSYGKLYIDNYINRKLLFKITCTENKQHTVSFEFVKKYDNRLF